MQIREGYSILIKNHPHHQQLNKKLMEEMDQIEYPMTNASNVKAKMSEWRLETPTCDILLSWIKSILLADRYHRTISVEMGNKLHLDQMWCSRYDEGEYTLSHDHLPSSFAFVYYVKCPKGSSPLVFDYCRKKVKAEEGKLIFFPASVSHSVPKNRCKDRVVLSGNLRYFFDTLPPHFKFL